MVAEDKLTKRARRKLGGNPSQAWPQMPKIQSPGARSNAYLRVAGLNNGTKVKAPALDPKLDLMNSPEVKFGRLLGSTDQRIRHEAVRRLGTYLTDRCAIGEKEGMGLSELDLLKLWKGLWYTLYMADRVPVQDELSKHLAELIWCVAGTEEEDEYAGKTYLDMYGEDYDQDEDDDDDDDEDFVMEEISNTLDDECNADCNHDDNSQDESDDGEDNEPEDEVDDDEENIEEDEDEDEDKNEIDEEEEEEDDEELDDAFIPHCRGAHLAALFIKTFFQTVRREWGRMDKYRVDKFYTLMRLMMEQVYSYMAKRHWNLGIIRLFNDTIHEEILSQTPNGLRLHLVDLTLNELAKVNARAPMPLTEATIIDVLEPFFAMAQACQDKIVQSRVVENVFYKFLNEYSVICESAVNRTDDDKDDEGEESLIMEHVHVGTVADFIFSLASDPATRNDYRGSLYTTYKDFKRRLKLVGNDVVLDLEEEENDEMNDEADEEKAESDDEEVRVIEVDDPINFEETEKSSKSKKKDAKKRKHNVIEEPPEVEKEDADDKPDSTKAKKKRKKKKGKVQIEENSVEAEEIKVTSSKKETKKTKTDNAEQERDEVISISVAAQKRAKQSLAEMEEAVEEAEEPIKKKNKKKCKQQKEADDRDEEGNRRVSFGKVNHSKSHKASMRALKTMVTPKPGPVTPDKSILRKKSPTAASSTVSGKKQKNGRKKAVDYF